jgi:Tfp pilus assembly protein PilF
MRYRGSDKPLRAIADELGVEFILEGTVRKQLSNLRITAKLIRADQDVQLWAETYRGTMDDVFEIQERVAAQIADALRLQLTPAEQQVLRKRATQDPEAYRLYLQGRFWWNKRTEVGFRRAIEFFDRAVEADPGYAVAHAGLADCYNLLSAYAMVAPGDAAPRAATAAAHALQLDPDLAEAHEADAHVGMLFEWNRKDIEERFRRAVSLNPQYATARQRLAIYLAASGRTGEALTLIRQARELDPLSLIINADEALVHILAGEFGAATEQARKTIELDPAFWVAHLVLGLASEQAGDLHGAAEQFQHACTLSADNAILLSALGHTLGKLGRVDDALRILGLLEDRAHRAFVPSYAMAVVQAGLGRNDEAARSLARALEERAVWLVHIHFATDPRLRTLADRSDGK